MCQHATHPQVPYHPVDMIVAFTYILDEQNRELEAQFADAIRCALQSVENG